MKFFIKGEITKLCQIDKKHKMRFAGIVIDKIGIGIVYRVKRKKCENLEHLCRWQPEFCNGCSGELFESNQIDE